MKTIQQLPLRSKFEGHPTITKNYLISTSGSYDEVHYKKFWLREHFNRFYKNHDASSLALKEASKEELEELKLSNKVELVTKPMSEYFDFVSQMAKLADFEEDKYDYYSVIGETRRTISWCTVRVAK